MKESDLLKLTQKYGEASYVCLWFCSALLLFVINTLVGRLNSDEVT